MDGFTSLFHPHRLISDNGPVPDEGFPDDFYLTDALTDRAIGMINGLRASDADKPFFLYFAHQAVHGPVQAKPEDIAKYRGRYDAGWEPVRGERFARQLRDGLFPEGTKPSDPDLPPWEGRTDLYARHMEVYAAAVDAVDQSLGRLVEHLKRIGEYENTIIVVTSDNGATADLAAEQPERVAELAAKWREAAWLNTVFPMADTPDMLNTRPPAELALSEPVTIFPGTPVLERFRSGKLTLLRSFTIEASLDRRPGDEGVIVAHGDQGGGYVLYVEDGELRMTYNAYGVPVRAAGPVPDGPVLVTARFTALPEMRWDIEVLAGEKPVFGIERVPQLLGMAPFTGISVGFDYGGPVDWELHERRGVFRCRRGLERVRYVPGEKAPYNPEIIALAEDLAQRAIE